MDFSNQSALNFALISQEYSPHAPGRWPSASMPTTPNVVESQLWMQFSWAQVAFTLIAIWPIIVAILRHSRERQRRKRFNFPTRDSFAQMTVRDAWAIQLDLMDTETSFFFMLALKFAIFSVNGIPSISSLLVRTNKLPSERVHLRYSMTSVMIAEFLAFPPDDERALQAISRMNNIHQTYQRAGQISNDDLLYTLGLFAYLPVRWVGKYDWRELTDMEKCALGTFWKDIGDCMEIDYSQLPSSKSGWKDGLHWLEEVTGWGDQYEEKNMIPCASNQLVALSAIGIILYIVPDFLKPTAKKMIFSLLEDRMIKALMLPESSELCKVSVKTILNARRYIVRYFFPPRPSCMRFQPLSAKADKDGRYYLQTYDSKPFYIKPTISSRWFSPAAIIRRVLGLPLPGDNGNKYHPRGYRLEELGPSWILARKTINQDVKIARQRLDQNHTTGCPFG
ncbi:hypothetical protein H112_02052 [Trichophyton rubrum D6]|uniref:Uncharacterized protein n=4 Tax=Trichophyton TaxID=5550 RepID=A0A178F0L8_TRIRU|nr:uncharacterized protein TERG_06810 [Trichophyton rubrum CBS 118892]EZF25744.1 hypothetical protein H100_02050 [Trichophyton rubrum MR850]EZF44755.1 hypothetical protein H102_02045 [Trichophyton rubrum CBS 100081]EZF55426.1 hypothetical protein H103_02056 [Trichophyton rubrum CBS 288.86]EZF66044.1 hypothetical protein H104_02032 [Trichophyton rubrum CBS 289.86]EZF76648.1 hypothetical protein H105_02064 [Trichophyton soudanense CBS 452.61]EZF87275.1 hypothetical protein H110_02056 [Trichophy